MSICPGCGRVADDEFVCAACGTFLGAGVDEPAAKVSVRWVALLAVLVCLLGVGAAVLLFQQDGGTNAGTDPLGGAPISLSSAPPLGAPGLGSVPDDASRTRPVPAPAVTTSPRSTSASTSASSSASASASTSLAASTSAHRTPSPTPTSSSASTSPHPHSTSPSSHPTTTRPPSSTTSSKPPPPPPTVQLSKGASCGRHCYSLVVSLQNFGSGAHTVNCWASHGGEFGSYQTSATTSSECSYTHPHDSVWVVVDGHRSNTVSW
jgi:hypothetical protein